MNKECLKLSLPESCFETVDNSARVCGLDFSDLCNLAVGALPKYLEVKGRLIPSAFLSLESDKRKLVEIDLSATETARAEGIADSLGCDVEDVYCLSMSLLFDYLVLNEGFISVPLDFKHRRLRSGLWMYA